MRAYMYMHAQGFRVKVRQWDGMNRREEVVFCEKNPSNALWEGSHQHAQHIGSRTVAQSDGRKCEWDDSSRIGLVFLG